jgi:hypothetical protein
VSTGDGLLYYGGGTYQTRTYNSRLSGGTCTIETFTFDAWEARTADVSGFVPPFSVR